MTSLKRVLVVDDSKVMRQSVSRVFRQLDDSLEIVEAEDGQAALALLSQDSNFALVVSDYNMPTMNGLELAKALQEQSATAKIPLVMLSEQSSKPLLEAGKEAKIRGWIIKPLRPEVAKTLIKGFIAAS